MQQLQYSGYKLLRNQQLTMQTLEVCKHLTHFHHTMVSDDLLQISLGQYYFVFLFSQIFFSNFPLIDNYC